MNKMWVKKINDFFDNMTEYDNSGLALHVSVDLIDMLKERVTFDIDDDCNMSITLLKYNDKEEEEVDEEGLLYWFQMTFHKELIDIILSLKEKFTGIQNSVKTLMNESKSVKDESRKAEISNNIEKNSKELEAIKKILSRVDTYRRNTFANLKDKESVEKILDHIRICKERSD